MSKLVRQVSLASNEDGVIGTEDGKLEFRNKNDLQNFSRFTAGTALIAGFKTAQSMVTSKGGVTPKKSRPLIVVTDVKRPVGDINLQAHVYYVQSVPGALALAEKIAERDDLRGYTVVGGATVYDQFFEMLDKGTTEVNKAYLFAYRHDEPVPADAVKMKRSPSQIVALIRNRMTKERFDRMECYEVGMVSNGTTNKTVMAQAQVIYITDTYEFDVTAARLMNDFRLEYRNGSVTVSANASQFSGYQTHPDMNSVTLYSNFGETRTDVRPGDQAAIDQLIDAYKQSLYLYN